MVVGIVTSILILFLFALLLIIAMFFRAKRLQIQKEQIQLPHWPKGFDGVTFLFITDIHKESFSSAIRRELESAKIDLVLLGGDLVEKGVPLSRARENVRFLCSLAPVYFVWGNHDYQVDFRELDILLRDEGVQVLDNRATVFEAGEDRVWLIGVDDVSRGRDELAFALQDIHGPGYRLLLAHDPKIIQKIKPEDQIGMVWCGHTHGGQILLPFFSSKILGPFYRQYSSGFYQLEEKGLTLFVSQGMGTSHLPLRLGTQAEIHLFTLRSEGTNKLTKRDN